MLPCQYRPATRLVDAPSAGWRVASGYRPSCSATDASWVPSTRLVLAFGPPSSSYSRTRYVPAGTGNAHPRVGTTVAPTWIRINTYLPNKGAAWLGRASIATETQCSHAHAPSAHAATASTRPNLRRARRPGPRPTTAGGVHSGSGPGSGSSSGSRRPTPPPLPKARRCCLDGAVEPRLGEQIGAAQGTAEMAGSMRGIHCMRTHRPPLRGAGVGQCRRRTASYRATTSARRPRARFIRTGLGADRVFRPSAGPGWMQVPGSMGGAQHTWRHA